ncbi:MAG: gliding motility-associated ABC transporter substrate-binding protein GldG [Bacteroidota bacterium]
MVNSKKIQSIIQLGLLIGILIAVNIIGNYMYTQVDLTEDKRFTLTQPTVELLQNLDEVVYVKILLDGNFPAGFKRLQSSVRELLGDFRSQSPYIEYGFENPSDGTVEEINARREELAKDGINPTNLRVKDVDETKELLIYPWAMMTYKGRSMAVNLLENEIMGMSSEEVLNTSISLLEYKLANAIQKLQIIRKPAIVLLRGHGELNPYETADLVEHLRPYYDIGPLNLDTAYRINPEIGVVIVARPRTAFSEREKFIIDQYVMNGGRVMWLIDNMGVGLDSLRGRKEFVPLPYDLKLEDQFFKYGFRIQPNLVLDFECTRIPLVTGQLGSGNQYDLFPWYYHPLVAPSSDHPIVKSLDRVNLRFPSTIDTIKTKSNVRKSILLSSSPRSLVKLSPAARLNFEMARYDADPQRFNKGPQPLAVMLEGEFPSLYENRVTEGMRAGLDELGESFKALSSPTKMLVVSDGDLARNLYNNQQQTVQPLGLNPFERHVFTANKDFLINAVEYLLDDKGVIEARTKEVKLRLLDTAKAKAEGTKWQLINILLPLLFLLLFGVAFNFIRRKRFGQ